MDERANVEKEIMMIRRVTFLYLFLASIWIIFSDIALEWFAPDITLYAQLQTYKGWGFVLVTGLLLYYLYLKPRTESLRRSQKALENHDEFIQAILDNLPIGLAVSECDSGNASYMNAKFSEIYGWPQEELTSVPRFFELVYPDPDYRKEITDRIMSDIQSGDTHRMRWDDISICTKEKGKRWISAVNIPIIEQNIMVSTVQDVTERKLMEMALRESEEDYRRLFEDHSAIKLLIDLDTGKIIQSNHAAAAYYGWTREELSQMTFPQINTLPPEVIDEEIRKVRARKSVCFEFKHRLADGSTRDVEVFSSTIKMKGKELLHSIIHDITNRKQAEKALQESERKFRNYVTNAPHGIFITDANANCLEINKTACMLTGYSEEELTGMNFNDLMAQESREKAHKNFIDLKNNGSASVELPFVHKDGIVYWLRLDASKLSETRYLVFASDITEKKKAEHSLINGKMMAEENSRIKSEFLANMSHELRTPLTAIIGFSDLLNIQYSGELNSKQLEFVDHISKSGKHLLNVINDILDLSKIEAGKMELECEYFSVSELIDEVQKSLYPLAIRKSIEVSINNNNKDTELFADKLKFKQIMYNLLNNAIKFTPDNGMISVVVKRTGKTIEVSVSDTGIGIPAYMQEKIFDPFVQVDASSKRKYGGTGLGLALTKRFVEMHNGKLWVESEKDKGSTFTFTLMDQKHTE